MKQAALFFIRTYQILLSPFLGKNCRFYPSCSDYARQAFDQKGFGRGMILSIKRILRCQPFSEGGFDPVE
jgi:hypothetical protein